MINFKKAFILLFILGPILIFAQTEPNQIKIVPTEEEISPATITIEFVTSSKTSTETPNFREKIQILKEKIKNIKSSDEFKNEIQKLKDEQKALREAINKRIEEIREQKEKLIKETRENLLPKIEMLKEKQREASLKMYDKINDLNKNFTDNYLKYISQIEEKLVKAEEKIKELKSRGLNTENAEKKLLEAQNKINELREQVLNQQNKIYDFKDLSTSTPVKQYFAQKVKEFRETHKNLRELIVKEGRSVVKNVLDEIKKLLATTTPSQQ